MPDPQQLGLPFAAPPPPPTRRASMVGMATSEEKLRGQVYTPMPVAEGMVQRLTWPARGPRLLDPACGEGVFLEAAVRRLKALDLAPERARPLIAQMHGWDLNAAALAECRERLEAASRALGFGGVIPQLSLRDALPAGPERFHAVLGNPPYLEAKRMPDAQKVHVHRCCPVAANGAFDLYGAFVERGWRALEPGGELCFIIPNRFLVAAYAEGLRRLLLAEGAVRVVDLSAERVFADAAVYPIVLHAERGAPPSYRVEPWAEPGGGVALPVATLQHGLDGMMPLPPASAGGRSLFARSLGGAPFSPLRERFDARWCVSFHRAGLRERFTFPQRPESRFARPFLGGGSFQGNREVEPYRIAWAGWWIDYDEERARRERNVLPPLQVHAAPKVVLCQNARRARAALDREGLVLKDTFLSLRCRRPADEGAGWLEWLVLVLGSDPFHFLYEQLYGGTRKGGGFLHFLPRYLDAFPLPPMPDPARVRAIHDALAAGAGDPAEAEVLVRAAWGIGPEEAEVLATACSGPSR